MTTAEEWLKLNCYSLKGVNEQTVRMIQRDTLAWAAEQIVIDGNPALARDKIRNQMRALDTDSDHEMQAPQCH